MTSVFMGVLLVLGPIAGYFMSGRTNQGLLIGLGLAALVLALYLIFERVPLDMLVFGCIGGVAGLILAKVLDWLIFKMDNPTAYNFVKDNGALINLFLALLGGMIAVRKKGELDLLDKDIIVRGNRNQDLKILDTSVLIDGRVSDIARTGFLSGKLLVPRFVLHELQQVADSADSTKRQRGRRGLDILKQLQEEDLIHLKVYDKDYPNIKEVDLKILELARELGAKVATTDFNLNKVAALQGISILNVNDLASAIKSVVLPGDTFFLYLAKEGKEKAQAVGYLDDGTMVVVDDARKWIGKRVEVHVNSILQTSAGRMIFARVQDSKGAHSDRGLEPGSSPEASIA